MPLSILSDLRFAPRMLVKSPLGLMLIAVQASAQDSVKFSLVRNQIVLPVVVGETDTAFMLLDTGVTPSGIDLMLARRMGWLTSEMPSGSVGGAGSGRAMDLFNARFGDARLGRTSLRGLDAVASDIVSALGRQIGLPLRGILGHSFLKTRRVRIDYERLVVVIEPAADPALRILYLSGMRLVQGDIMPRVEVLVDGTVVPVSLDTGSSVTLELWPEAARRAGVVADSGSAVALQGARGGFEARRGRARSLELGEVRRSNAEVLIAPSARGSSDREGNLGNGFFAGLVLTLDYVNSRIEIAERR